MLKMKVSFDFDGTLTRLDVQRYARLLNRMGLEIHIVTARHKAHDLDKNDHQDLWMVANKVGILDRNVHFLNCADKSKFFIKEDNDFIFHVDDNWFTVDDINEHTDVTSVCVLDEGWLMKCDELIKDNPLEKVSKEYYRKRILDLLMSLPKEERVDILDKAKQLIKNESKNEKSSFETEV